MLEGKWLFVYQAEVQNGKEIPKKKPQNPQTPFVFKSFVY